MVKARGRLLAALTGSLVAEAVNKVVPLLILRFVVARIGVEGFGYAQFGYWLVDFALNFVTAGYAYVAAVELGRAAGDRGGVKRVISEVLILKLMHCVVAAMILYMILWLVPSYHRYAPVTISLSFVLVTTALDMGYVHVGTQRMLSLSVLTIGVKLVSLASILLFVRGPDDLLLFALLYFGVNGAIAVGNFVMNTRRFGLSLPTPADLSRRFAAALPFALMAALWIGLDRYDVFFIEDLLGPEGAGLYGGPLRVVQALGNVVVAIGQVFFSEVVAAKDQEAATQRAYLGLWSMLALLLPIAVGAWFVGGDLLGLVLGAPYAGLGKVFTILLAALCAQAMVQVFGIQILLVNKRAKVLNGTLAAAILVGVGLALTLRQPLGMIGIALASLVARSVAALTMALLAGPYLARLPGRELTRTVLPAVGMGLVLAATRLTLIPALAVGGSVYTGLLIACNRERAAALVDELRKRAAA